MRLLSVYLILLIVLPAPALTSQHSEPNSQGFHALVPVFEALKRLKTAQTCDAQSCGVDQTCCNIANGPSCCPFQGACCCPDQRFCCVPVGGQVTSCVCYGSCPGEGCSCVGCEDNWKTGRCTNSNIQNPPSNQTSQNWPTYPAQPAIGALIVPTFIGLAASLGFCALVIC
jgi:hypothetical protein